MDFHDKESFDRLVKLTEENNKILHKMWRATRVAGLVRIFYWLLVIGVSIGAFYYLQPYIDQLMAVYGGIQDSVGSFQSLVGHTPQ